MPALLMAAVSQAAAPNRSWWDRNGPFVQAITTIVLAAITAHYAWTTRRILRSQERSTKAAETQATLLREEIDDARLNAAAEHGRWEQTYLESVHTRLAASSPVVTVDIGSAGFTIADNGQPGMIAVSEFRTKSYSAMFGVRLKNHGPGPCAVVVESPGRFIGHEAWNQEFIVEAGVSCPLSIRLEASGGQWLDAWNAEQWDPFVIVTRAPLTGVLDRHSWAPTLILDVAGDVYRGFHLVDTPTYAEIERTFPI